MYVINQNINRINIILIIEFRIIYYYINNILPDFQIFFLRIGFFYLLWYQLCIIFKVNKLYNIF